MGFEEFLNLYNAYKLWVASGKKGSPAQPQTITPPAQPQTITPPAQPQTITPPAQPQTITPPAQPEGLSQLEQRIAMLEQRSMTPSTGTIEPMGLEDVFSRMLGEETGGKK